MTALSGAVLERPLVEVIVDSPDHGLYVARRNDGGLVAVLDRNKFDDIERNDEPDEFESAADDIIDAAELLANPEDRALYQMLGFNAIVSPYNVIKLTSPSDEVLNNTRAEIADFTGISKATFVGFDGGFIPYKTYNDALAERTILWARNSTKYSVHDGIFHPPGDSRMAEEMFDTFAYGTRHAKETNNIQHATEVVEAFDVTSGMLSIMGTAHGNDEFVKEDNYDIIAGQYARFMHPLAAGLLAGRDLLAQQQCDQKLQQLAKVY